MLNSYIAQVQRFCRDQKQEFLDIGNLTDYINRARREIAGMTQCIRVLTPISGSVISAQVVQSGSNYSSQTTIVITPPDAPSATLPKPSGAQATAVPILQGGALAAVDIAYGGSGYFQPIANVVDPLNTGSGASVTLQISPINTLNMGQEQYSFSDIDLSAFPGAGEVLMIRSLSVIYANFRYSLPLYSMSVYQSMIRQYPFGLYQYVPCFATQFGQGASGTFLVYPIPSQLYQWEFDCTTLPQNLIDDQSVEIIPQPWVDTVPYFAAHLAFAELQNLNASKYYLDLFDKMTIRKSNYARPGRVTNPYGRW